MITPSEIIDYSSITETPGLKATDEQLERLYQRYNFAREFSQGKDVLEVACGSGLGLGFLAESARSVRGVDIDKKNISIAKTLCRDSNKINIDAMDAHKLTLPDNSIDVVLLFEAIYYLADPKNFINEAWRILRKDGTLIVCTVNKDWDDFHPSPYAHKYFSVPELTAILSDSFKDIKIYGGFPILKTGIRDATISFIKRLASKLDLIPGSLSARAYLKKIFIGKLTPLPDRIYDGVAPYEEPVKIPHEKENRDFKIIYAIAHKGN